LPGLGDAVALILAGVRRHRAGGCRPNQAERQQSGNGGLNRCLLFHDCLLCRCRKGFAKTGRNDPSAPWSCSHCITYTMRHRVASAPGKRRARRVSVRLPRNDIKIRHALHRRDLQHPQGVFPSRSPHGDP
jgi:hypothetical protein